MKCRTCGTTLSAGALLCGECGTSAIAPRPTLGDTAHHDRRALLAAINAVAPPAPATAPPAPTPVPAPDPAPGNSPTRHSSPAHATPPIPSSRPLFSLVFSTGESVRVSGSGLVGRNPVPAADERFDYLVQIVDPERSVSKTHLEFGIDRDELWLRDRGSANGTRVGLDLVDPIELDPGEWRRVHRGTRVGIGDEYFDVH